jgi:hypothetical protein
VVLVGRGHEISQHVDLHVRKKTGIGVGAAKAGEDQFCSFSGGDGVYKELDGQKVVAARLMTD